MTLPYELPPEAFAVTTARGKVAVRPLTTGDRDAWTRLWTAYLVFYETELKAAQYDLNWARLFDPAEPVFGFLAEQDGRPVGLVHIIFHRSFWLEGPSCYLQDLYADPEVRGSGVGRALIEHVYTVAKAAGSAKVHWLTKHDNAVARRLYDRIATESGFIQYVKGV
jgi:GNAT superfamily N-acetyltransferase